MWASKGRRRDSAQSDVAKYSRWDQDFVVRSVSASSAWGGPISQSASSWPGGHSTTHVFATFLRHIASALNAKPSSRSGRNGREKKPRKTLKPKKVSTSKAQVLTKRPLSRTRWRTCGSSAACAASRWIRKDRT